MHLVYPHLNPNPNELNIQVSLHQSALPVVIQRCDAKPAPVHIRIIHYAIPPTSASPFLFYRFHAPNVLPTDAGRRDSQVSANVSNGNYISHLVVVRSALFPEIIRSDPCILLQNICTQALQRSMRHFSSNFSLVAASIHSWERITNLPEAIRASTDIKRSDD